MREKQIQAFISSLSKPVVLSILHELIPVVGQGLFSTFFGEAGDRQKSLVQPEGKLTLEGMLSKLEQLDEKTLQQGLEQMLIADACVALLAESLSDYERKVLFYFMLQVGRDFLSERHIAQGLTGLQPHTFRLGLIGLQRKGLIYTLRRQWGEEGYLFPIELVEKYYQYFFATNNSREEEAKAYHEQLQQIEVEQPEMVWRPLYQTVFFIVDDLRLAKEGRIPLTQKGTIHKRYVNKWESYLDLAPISLQAFDVLLQHQDAYSPGLAILLHYFTTKQLIIWQDEFLVIDLDAVDQFMGQARSEMMKDFRDYWFEHFIPKKKWMQCYYRDAFFAQDKVEWIPLLQFVESWESHFTLPTIPELVVEIQQELLAPLYALGLIEYGLSPQQERLWRYTPVEEQAIEVWVQPNLECFCSSLTPLSILWRLSEVFTLEEWDHLLVLQPSEQKLTQALERGVSLTVWLNWLETVTKLPVPQELAEYLLRFKKKTQQVTIREAVCLTVSEPELHKALSQYCAQNDIDVLLSAAEQLVVQRKDQEAIQSFLLQNHIHIQEMKEGGANKEHASCRKMESSLLSFTHWQVRDKLRVKSVFPSFTAAIPAWNQFPDMWKKQLVAYHEQTKRDILEQAIEHHLDIQYETITGERFRIKPITQRALAGEWVCIAENKGSIPLQDMKRMQLLFPVSLDT